MIYELLEVAAGAFIVLVATSCTIGVFRETSPKNIEKETA